MWKSDRARRLAAALLVLLFAHQFPAAGFANDNGGGQDRSEQRDAQSRNERASRMSHIPIRYSGGYFQAEILITIQTRFLHVTDNFSRELGIDFESLDRLDVSDVPLLGSLFDKPLRAEDFTEENRVGAVYRAADGTLVAVLDDDVEVGDSAISVVNGDGRYNILTPPKPAEGPLPDLGEFGSLRSVQTMLRGVATKETTIVLGGLTVSSAPDVTPGVPVLGDIPVLGRLFMGPVHEVKERELVILIKPTIVIQKEEE